MYLGGGNEVGEEREWRSDEKWFFFCAGRVDLAKKKFFFRFFRGKLGGDESCWD